MFDMKAANHSLWEIRVEIDHLIVMTTYNKVNYDSFVLPLKCIDLLLKLLGEKDESNYDELANMEDNAYDLYEMVKSLRVKSKYETIYPCDFEIINLIYKELKDKFNNLQ